MILSLNMGSRSIPIVFEHYEVPEGVEGTFRAKWKHCKNPEVTISGSTKSTSNFLLHLKVNMKSVGPVDWNFIYV